MKTSIYPTLNYGRVEVNVFPPEKHNLRKFTLCVKGSVYEAFGDYTSMVRLIDTADKQYPGLKRQMNECANRGAIIDYSQQYRQRRFDRIG